MRAIICVSAGEFVELNRRIHEGLAADVEGYNAERWATPIIHPVDERIAIPIEERVEKYLTPDELARVVELSDDWFPKLEEEARERGSEEAREL